MIFSPERIQASVSRTVSSTGRKVSPAATARELSVPSMPRYPES
jgi:hypothetical protein